MPLKKNAILFGTLSLGIFLTLQLVTLLHTQTAKANEAAVVQNTAVFPVLADFEGAYPPDWFVYADWGGGATMNLVLATVADTDPNALPGQVGDNGILSGTVNIPTWGGIGAAFIPVQDWSSYDAVSFWFYGENSGTTHEFEIQTVSGDDRRASFVDDFTGWKQIILPFNTFGTGGAYDVSQVDNWVFVLDGTTGSFKMDNLQLVNLQTFANYEGAYPPDWFVYADWGGGATMNLVLATIPDTDPDALPGQVGDNGVLSATVNIPTWGGVGAAFIPVQDWSHMQGVSIWFYGENSGTTHEFEIQTVQGDDRRASFTDNFMGWQLITLPFTTFGAGGAYDVSQVDNWVFVLDGTVGSFKMDNVGLYGDAGIASVLTQFEAATYSLEEGATATLTVTLNITSTEPVSVSYATSDGTAIAGTDYTPVSGTLVFAPGSSAQALTVTTLDNAVYTGNRTLTVILSNPVNAGLGTVSEATLTIVDNEQSNAVIADFEGAYPPDWFVYGDWGGGVTMNLVLATIPDTDPDALPGQVGDNGVFSGTVNVPSWGGVGALLVPPQDWSGYDAISFWFYGENSGTSHEFEIQTVPGDDRRAAFIDNFTGWQQIILPFSTFGAGGAFDVSQVDAWVFVLDGTVGSFKLDNLQLVNLQPFADFEGAYPPDWFVYGDWGGGVTMNLVLATIPDTDPDALPGQIGDNGVFSGTVNVPSWGGFGALFAPAHDWSNMQGVSFWFYGVNSGVTHEFEIQTVQNDDRRASFVDDFNGWRLVTLPFATFGAGGAYDVSQVNAWVFVLDGTVGSFKLDNVGVYGDAGTMVLKTQFNTANYTVLEGDLAQITVTLNMASASPVTVTYATADGTAVAGQDYTATTGQLVFQPGSTAQAFTVETLGDAIFTGNRALSLNLSDPINVILGAPNQATLTILEDDASNACALRATDVDNFESGALPHGVDGDGMDVGFFTWTGPGASVNITTTFQVTNTVLQMDSSVPAGSWGGMTHHFENGNVDTWVPQDWSSYQAVGFWVYGTNTGKILFFEVQDNRNPGSTSDDTEIFNYTFTDNFSGWKHFEVQFSDFNRKDIGNGAPNDGFTLTEVHGWAFGSTEYAGTLYLNDVQICGYGTPPELQIAFEQADYEVVEAATATITVSLNMTATHPVTVSYQTGAGYATANRDYTPVSGTLVIPAGELAATFEVPTIDDLKYEGDETLALELSAPISATLGFQDSAILIIADNDVQDTNAKLLDDFEGYHPFNATAGVTLDITELITGTASARPGQGTYEQALSITTGNNFLAPSVSPFAISRTFATGQDWTGYEGMSFWVYGQNTGQDITVQILDNPAITTGATLAEDWQLVWSDEFNAAGGTAPNPNVWGHETGDGTLNGNIGWGNSELEYYTNNPENVGMDGLGNLVITATKVNTATSDLMCYYGPCEYTSARLLTANRFEVEYGRVEARIQVPYGNGIWPAFWMLGGDIGQVGWPQSGELDIMENIGREPSTVYGTIHGPGYSGCCGVGGNYTLPSGNLSDEFHVFAVEWSPEEIRWYIDDINYFTATINDIPAGTEWVFDHPFFILLNVAVGGNWPGNPDDTTLFPQTMHVDYVRVYQAADTAERFEYTFTDNFSGWQKVTLPFDVFTRSANQPLGAPNDGLTLTNVMGYGFSFPEANSYMLDYIRLEDVAELIVPPYKLFFPIIHK